MVNSKKEQKVLNWEFEYKYNLSRKLVKIPLLKFFYSLLNPQASVIFFYRKSKIFYLKNKKLLSRICYLANYYINHIDISPKADIGKGVQFPHPVGIVIGSGSKVGEGSIILSCVTLGTNSSKKDYIYEYPSVGKNCYIGSGAKLIGGIIIGSNTTIGANAVVVKSFPNNSTLVGVPAKQI